MVLNTKGVEVSEVGYINKAGKYLLQITKFEMDGTTQAGDPKFKFSFKGVENGTKEPVVTHSESFSTGAKALWRVKILEIAIKAPEVYDLNDFVGRYVLANIVQETYTKKDGSDGTIFKAKSWEYSTHNDKLAPIPVAVDDNEDDDDEDMPF